MDYVTHGKPLMHLLRCEKFHTSPEHLYISQRDLILVAAHRVIVNVNIFLFYLLNCYRDISLSLFCFYLSDISSSTHMQVRKSGTLRNPRYSN